MTDSSPFFRKTNWARLPEMFSTTTGVNIIIEITYWTLYVILFMEYFYRFFLKKPVNNFNNNWLSLIISYNFFETGRAF